MRTLKARLTAACKAMRDAIVRTWNTFILGVRHLGGRRYARGGFLPSGSVYIRHTTGRPERVNPYPTPTRGKGEFGSPNRT